MRSNSLRRTVSLGLSTLVLLTGLSFAPSGVAFAADGVVPTPSATPSAAPTGTPDPTPTPAPSETPTDTPEPTPTPTTSPSAAPTPEPEPSETATPTPSAEPSAEPTPAPPEVLPPAMPELLNRMMARTVNGFSAGNIISDYNFFDSWAMTEAEIQSFLNQKISGPCENSNCLNVLRVNTPNASWSWGTCAPYAGAPNESAARIIYKVQRACGLSAKVILVTLQKEQSLVTRTGPSTEILRKAMGMGCPDTDVCDAQYYGFFNQIYAAARQLTWYTNPDSSMYKSKKYEVGQVKPVQFSPNASCGSSGVLIENVATAALYHYTPYQPSAASLAAGWGPVPPGDPCGAYGNRNFSLYFNSWFGNPTAGPNPSAQRIAGDSRYATAAAISRSVFSGESSVPVVYIATGEDFPDALAAGPAAAVQGGPLLLVNPGFITDPTVAELQRLKPKKIVIVGGPTTVSPGVESALAALAREFKNSPATTIKRIAGADRYETSRLIAKEAFPQASGVYIATGLNFPDALSATAAAGSKKQPVLLVNGQMALDQPTVQAVKALGAGSVVIVGGEPSVNPQIPTALAAAGISARRLAGPDRWLTSVAVNKDAFGSPSGAYLATGFNFPDALAGAAAAARVGTPLYVTMPNCVSTQLRDELKRPSVKGITLLGGTPSLAAGLEYLPTC